MAGVATNYINGEWISSEKENASINPATKEVVGYYSEATILQAEEAIQAAIETFQTWSKISLVNRANLLKSISNVLKDNRESLAEMITKEMGKPYREACGEVDVAIQTADYFMGEGRRVMGEVLPSFSNMRHIHTLREAVGVVGVITPWNYPISLATYKIFSAFIAGNSVVWKPSPEVNCTAKLFVELLEQAGLPKGVLNLVTASTPDIGEYIVNHDQVPLITFTGSTHVGKIIATQAAQKLKRVTLELGGNNASIVLADANIDLAVTQIANAGFGTSGQRCTATRRVFVQEDVYETFLEKLIAAAKKIKVGNGLLDETTMGPVIHEHSVKQIEQAVQQAIVEGAKVEFGGTRLLEDDGYFYAPTILSNINSTYQIAQEEVFGPVLSIIKIKSYEEAVQLNNQTDYGLSTAIFTQDLALAMRAQHDLKSGLIYINAGTANAEMGVPFGGMKNSGNGEREVSHHMLNFMTEWKSVYINYEG